MMNSITRQLDATPVGEAKLVEHPAGFPNIQKVGRAARPLRICLVYSRTPLPMRRADQMTVAHLLAFLHARGHQVDLFYIDTGGNASDQERAWLAAHTRHVESFEQDLWSVIRGLVRVATQRLPVQVGLFSHSKQRRAVLEAVQRNRYDILYTYYFRSAEITKDLGLPPVARDEERAGRPASFLAFQLSQTLNTRRISKNAPDLRHRLFYKIESQLVERYEARIWKHFTRTVLIGKSDVEEIRAACRRQHLPEFDNFVYSAHGTDTARFRPRRDIPVKPDHLVFSGVMRTPTNVQAVQWFVNHAWPLIRAERPNATFSIIGREPTREVLELAKQPGVTVTGTVPDPALLIAEASVCVNPMQAGGGMQNKLIEFLATEKPVVATSIANEGIGAPAEAIRIADTPSEFARAVIELLTDEVKARDMAHRARAYILENWTWESHFLKLENEFYGAVGAPLAAKPNVEI